MMNLLGELAANLTGQMGGRGGNWTGAAKEMAKKVNPMAAVHQLLQNVTELLGALLSHVQSLLSALQLILPVVVGIFALFCAFFLLLFCVLLFVLIRLVSPRRQLPQPIDRNVRLKSEKIPDQNAVEEQMLMRENEKTEQTLCDIRTDVKTLSDIRITERNTKQTSVKYHNNSQMPSLDKILEDIDLALVELVAHVNRFLSVLTIFMPMFVVSLTLLLIMIIALLVLSVFLQFKRLRGRHRERIEAKESARFDQSKERRAADGIQQKRISLNEQNANYPSTEMPPPTTQFTSLLVNDQPRRGSVPLHLITLVAGKDQTAFWAHEIKRF